MESFVALLVGMAIGAGAMYLVLRNNPRFTRGLDEIKAELKALKDKL